MKRITARPAWWPCDYKSTMVGRVFVYRMGAEKLRLKKAMASMALDEASLRRGGEWGPNDLVQYPFKIPAKNLAARYAVT